jgi:hypothetical protein
VFTLAINNVAQKEEVALKSYENVAGARRTQPPVVFGAFVSRIKRKSLIISIFSYVILKCYSLICHCMHET